MWKFYILPLIYYYKMPFLHGLVDSLYNAVMDFAPEFLRQRPMFSAAVLGASGAFGLVKGLQEVSMRWMDNIVTEFDERWLPELEKACLAGVPALALGYALVDPEGMRQVVSEHPVYTAGMVSAYAGAATATLQDLMARPDRKYAKLLDGTRVLLEDM